MSLLGRYFGALKDRGIDDIRRHELQAAWHAEGTVTSASTTGWSPGDFKAALERAWAIPFPTMAHLAKNLWTRAAYNQPHWVRHELPNGTRVAVRYRHGVRELAIRRGEPLTSATLDDWTAEQIGLRRAFGLDSAKAVPGVVDGCPMTTFEGRATQARATG